MHKTSRFSDGPSCSLSYLYPNPQTLPQCRWRKIHCINYCPYGTICWRAEFDGELGPSFIKSCMYHQQLSEQVHRHERKLTILISIFPELQTQIFQTNLSVPICSQRAFETPGYYRTYFEYEICFHVSDAASHIISAKSTYVNCWSRWFMG